MDSNIKTENPEPKKQLRALWNADFSALLGKSYILADSSDVKGVAVWMKADFTGTDIIPFLVNGGIKLLPYIPRMLSYEAYANKLKERHIQEDTWYLYDLAVREDAQKTGVMSELMRPPLSYFDSIGADCYLETHDKNNVPRYEHYGFDLVETGLVPNSDLKHYSMLRKAR